MHQSFAPLFLIPFIFMACGDDGGESGPSQTERQQTELTEVFAAVQIGRSYVAIDCPSLGLFENDRVQSVRLVANSHKAISLSVNGACAMEGEARVNSSEDSIWIDIDSTGMTCAPKFQIKDATIDPEFALVGDMVVSATRVSSRWNIDIVYGTYEGTVGVSIGGRRELCEYSNTVDFP